MHIIDIFRVSHTAWRTEDNHVALTFDWNNLDLVFSGGSIGFSLNLILRWPAISITTELEFLLWSIPSRSEMTKL